MLLINLDISPLISLRDNLEPAIRAAVVTQGRRLAGAMYAHAVEEANKKLHSRRQMYIDNLSLFEAAGDATAKSLIPNQGSTPPTQAQMSGSSGGMNAHGGGVWVLNLDRHARWIDDGRSEGEMIDDLLKSDKAKTSKDGCVLNPRSKVVTSVGMKSIKDIVPGDMVLTHSGKFREVRELLVSDAGLGTEYVTLKARSSYSVNTKSIGCTLTLTPEHLVLTRTGWVPAAKICVGDEVATPGELGKNHSGQLGISWVKIKEVRRGVVDRKDHIFSKKYDICLDAEEHSFCCQTVLIHNSRHLSVPFDHGPGKGATSTTPAQQSLIQTIKAEFGSRGIPFGKLETGPTGQPLLGTVRRLSIMNAPLKTGTGPGQGWGPIGSVRQGPTGIPFLQGISVMQKGFKDKVTGKESVKKVIMTWRTVSSKMKGTGRWVFPGVPPTHILDEAFAWGLREWENRIKADVLAEVIAAL